MKMCLCCETKSWRERARQMEMELKRKITIRVSQPTQIWLNVWQTKAKQDMFSIVFLSMTLFIVSPNCFAQRFSYHRVCFFIRSFVRSKSLFFYSIQQNNQRFANRCERAISYAFGTVEYMNEINSQAECIRCQLLGG